MGDSLGEYFQRAREAKGLTLDEAAARTRILPQYLKAVEENNYARLPDEVFAKGFVRSYARILGLDEAAVIRKFDESGGQFYAKRAERETLRQQLEEVERNFSGALPLEGVAPDDRKKMVLDVEAIERCWVKVQTDRAAPQEVLLNPGDRVRWKAQERLALTLGNAGGVRVMLNGKVQGPFGARGQVVREIVFTP